MNIQRRQAQDQGLRFTAVFTNMLASDDQASDLNESLVSPNVKGDEERLM